MNKLTKYLITITPNQVKHYISVQDINDVILWLKMAIPSLHILHYSYENSGHYRYLHFHAVVEVTKYFRWSPYTKFGIKETHNTTFRVFWKRVTKLQGAIEYVYKDTHNNSILQDQILKNNYYLHHYYNTDTEKFERSEILIYPLLLSRSRGLRRLGAQPRLRFATVQGEAAQ